MSAAVTVDFKQPISVFPLPDCVQLPHTALPLHIFEPRYRTMVCDALDSRGLIAMALFDGSLTKEQYLHGRPEVRPYLCVGHISQYQSLPDGRYLLLLSGLCRARLAREVDHEPYRLARLEPVESAPASEADLRALRDRLTSHLGQPALDTLKGVAAIREHLGTDVATPVVVDQIISALCADTDGRYRMLAEPDAISRGEWLLARIERLVETGGFAAGGGDTPGRSDVN